MAPFRQLRVDDIAHTHPRTIMPRKKSLCCRRIARHTTMHKCLLCSDGCDLRVLVVAQQFGIGVLLIEPCHRRGDMRWAPRCTAECYQQFNRFLEVLLDSAIFRKDAIRLFRLESWSWHLCYFQVCVFFILCSITRN